MLLSYSYIYRSGFELKPSWCIALTAIARVDPNLARIEAAQHAILARVADSYRLKDLNSTNGPQVKVPPDARPSSKQKRRAGRKHVLPSLFYGNGGTKFRKTAE
jgi:hypothetical protein